MEQYADVQQLMKKENGQNRKPVYPPTVIQAVFEGKTGASLEAILAQFNSIYVQYQGTPKDTRLIIPMEMRRAGLTITYMDMDSNTITERANSAVQKDNDHWGLDVNWSRVDELSLSGDISVSAKGTWIINGKDTGVKALGPKGDTGLTPWLKTIDNKLHFSYGNVTWEPCSDYIAAWFRWNDNKIQISRDNKTWADFSEKFADNVHIKGYVANYASLPTGAVQGDIYGVGPTYAAEDTAHTNPIYRYYVRNANTWVDNGAFTSHSAGVVQETGNSETEVMSQKAVSTKLSELGTEVSGIFEIAGKYDEDIQYCLNAIRDANISLIGFDKIAVEYLLKNYSYNSVVYNCVNLSFYNGSTISPLIVSSKTNGVGVELLDFTMNGTTGVVLVDWTKVKDGKTNIDNKLVFSGRVYTNHYGYIELVKRQEKSVFDIAFNNVNHLFEKSSITVQDLQKLNDAIIDARIKAVGFGNIGIEYILKNKMISNVVYNNINIFGYKNGVRKAFSFPSKTKCKGIEMFSFETEGLSGTILIDWSKIEDGQYSFDERLIFSEYSKSQHYGLVDNYCKDRSKDVFITSGIKEEYVHFIDSFFIDAVVTINDSSVVTCGVNNVIKNTIISNKLYNSISLFVKIGSEYTYGVYESKSNGIGIELLDINWLGNNFKILVNWDAINEGITEFDVFPEFSYYALKNHYGSVTVFEEIGEIKNAGFKSNDFFYVRNKKLICNNSYKSDSGTVAKYLKADMGKNVKKIMAKFTTLGGDLALISTNLDTSKKVYDIVRRSVHIVFGTNSVAYGCYWGGTWTRSSVSYDALTTDDKTEYEVGYEILDDLHIRLYLPNGETTDVECDRLNDCNGQYVIYESYTYSDTTTSLTEQFSRVGITGIYCETEDENTLVLKDNFKREDGNVFSSPTGHIYTLFRNASTSDSIYDNI